MDDFLLQIVKNSINGSTNLAELVFILPNRRSGIYLKKYLKKEIANSDFLPLIKTFDNFAEQLAGVSKISQTELLFDFYSVYKKIAKKDAIDSFENFSKWASILLNDFNDIDGNLVNPKDIFDTLKNINTIQNWNPDTTLTKNYLAFFQDLYKYYTGLNKLLEQKQKSYQGMIFRKAVKNINHYTENTQQEIIFIGFNYLKNSEIQIIQELLSVNRAKIFFDISKDNFESNNLSNKYIKHYKDAWPYFNSNSFSWINEIYFNPDKVTITGISKNVGMLKYAGEILNDSTDIKETALVLADQNLLNITLNTIPNEIDNVNITMGIPLKNFPFTDLVNVFFKIHLDTSASNSYYYKSVFLLIQHPILQAHYPEMKFLIEKLTNDNKASLVFSDIYKHTKNLSPELNKLIKILFEPLKNPAVQNILIRLNLLITILRNKVKTTEREVLFHHYKLIQQLSNLTTQYSYVTTLKSLYEIYKQLIYAENLNFIGEPLQGLQIMGFLETQAIDFKHVIITSLNEGILPKDTASNSFIPYDVRKHYKLKTKDDDDAIASYHFHRLLQRTKKIELLYNISNDTFGGGEKSRFITNLLWKYPNIRHQIIHIKVPSEDIKIKQIEKTKAVINKLKKWFSKGISPSALGTYLYNPIDFYYQRVLGVYEVDSIEETVENNTMGTILHNTLESLYKPFVNTFLNIESLKKTIKKIPNQVGEEFTKEYNNGQFNQGKNKLIYEIIVNHIKRFINNEIKQLENGRQIKIIALEIALESEVQFDSFNFPIKFKGYVDRIDEVDGTLRIVDYKSGMVNKSDLKINNFTKLKDDYKYSKALQVLLYTYLYTKTTRFDDSQSLFAGIISFRNLNTGFIPVNFGEGRKNDFLITKGRLKEYLAIIEDLLNEIIDIHIPFTEKENI